MPIYDYQCSVCRGQFEAKRGFAADAPPCPRCGGRVELFRQQDRITYACSDCQV